MALWLDAITAFSDAVTESLSKRETRLRSWHITLDNLPASAAKILRDAGHGMRMAIFCMEGELWLTTHNLLLLANLSRFLNEHPKQC